MENKKKLYILVIALIIIIVIFLVTNNRENSKIVDIYDQIKDYNGDFKLSIITIKNEELEYNLEDKEKESFLETFKSLNKELDKGNRYKTDANFSIHINTDDLNLTYSSIEDGDQIELIIMSNKEPQEKTVLLFKGNSKTSKFSKKIREKYDPTIK